MKKINVLKIEHVKDGLNGNWIYYIFKVIYNLYLKIHKIVIKAYNLVSNKKMVH